MAEPIKVPFLAFLEAGVSRGGFETDDVLAALLPLMRQVLSTHEVGLVTPLDGIEDLFLNEQGYLSFAQSKATSPRKNTGGIESVQSPVSRAIEVIAESRRTAEIDEGSLAICDLSLHTGEGAITKPVFVAGYRSWEHALGHHDQLTDIFSLGMLLASIACGLDFTQRDELELFVANRSNLFCVNRRLNPVLASVVVQMTELNRHKRAPDLGQLISRLENYREQATELDVHRLDGFKEAGVAGKRRLIQAHLRDRLFEISRRNRLIHFKPTLQTLNLTIASVPLLLDYRNIKLEQLFIWHFSLAATITDGAPMSLGKYLRFEDAAYLPGALDKIISEARRDRAEFGFAQLRLVLCFLHWNNLKEAPSERIHSPLLLLPVELTKKKGVRDNYVLDPTTSDAEVNPALRHHLKELYNLSLPESVDLKETSLDDFYNVLQNQIQASEPGVTLNKIDRPQIELIHEKARQRVDQYRRRMKLQARRVRSASKTDYSYDREHLRPLGLQLFLEKVRPTPMPLRDVLGAPPVPRAPHAIGSTEPRSSQGSLESERQMFSLRERSNQNAYSWDFDLCSLTLGNFNYRKMTLVRDYAKLIEADTASTAFDTVFSLNPKAPEEVPPPLPLGHQHLIIPCDAAQASAIARARSGASFIIQGPPGTGKSQTITNLIADYVARGKRVLFVCEKRAAIDVVFHRLRQQGLDELCCLIHDSQTDKKAFIQNLKQTYEQFLSSPELDSGMERSRDAAIRAMEQDLADLQRFADVMRQSRPQTGIAVRSLLHRLVELRGRARDLPPDVEELLPEYSLWLRHGNVVERLTAAFSELGEELCFAKHPLRWLGRGVLEADRPIEALASRLDRAEDLLDDIQSALELSGLPAELWDTFEEIQSILDFAVRVRPLAERDLLAVLATGPKARTFDELSAELDAKVNALTQAQRKTTAWREPLSPDDTQNALVQAQAFEKSIFRIFLPAFWRLKKTLESRYDFSQHAVAPTWSKVLAELVAQQAAQAALDTLIEQARQAWRTDDVQGFRDSIDRIRTARSNSNPSVEALIERISHSPDAGGLVQSLAAIHDRCADLGTVLRSVLSEHEQVGFDQLAVVLAKLREQAGLLAELSPLLGELVALPEAFNGALRRAEVPLPELEGAIAYKSLNLVYRQDRAVNRFDGRIAARKMEQLEKHYHEWLGINARCLRAAVRRQFTEHVNLSSMPLSQVQPNQKALRKSYAAGRRDLEHEFAKTMRYKSIRELAAGDTGNVIRDLKPIWLMSPVSVSDTLPLDPDLFDVVIFDEASQIPLEEAIPAIYRSHQVIVVGDEMQLPPTTFFATSRTDDDSVIVEEEGERFEVDLDSDSFLTQSAQNLPSTLLAWHYRSRYESLISFSNSAFYSGNLFTIPDRQCASERQPEIRVTAPAQAEANVEALLARSISFHFLENGVYQDRTNPTEALYIAHLVRTLLGRATKLSIGIVAFSEAQQAEIENALNRLAVEDEDFAHRLETDYVREENGVFCGLFVKNLENVQGDERDIIIMSVCYGHDAHGRMLMNFGPINQRGGEKRLNVIFSRAKHHMAVVTSIRHGDVTNEYNDGANSLKNFLHYAEAVSTGDALTARRVLESLNPLSRQALAPLSEHDAVVQQLGAALRSRGYSVDINVGQSKFRCDLAVRKQSDSLYRLGILVDTDGHYANSNLLDVYLFRPSILRAFGWSCALVLTKDWYHNPDDVLARLQKTLDGKKEEPNVDPRTEEEVPPTVATSNAVEPANPTPPISSPPFQQSPGQKVGSVPSVPEPLPRRPDSVRRFELIGDSSRKFWEITFSGSSFTVRFGRIGTAGQTQTKTFSDAAKAKEAAENLIAQKLRKGYAEHL